MSDSSVLIYQVDAFTNQVFQGNPAAVCFLDRPIGANPETDPHFAPHPDPNTSNHTSTEPPDPASAETRWMQAFAAEMNLSETAFIQPQGDRFSLRWFTPTIEVDLCGHATLAAAHILWESGKVAPAAEIYFDTRSGQLTAQRQDDWIILNFPAQVVKALNPIPSLLLESLGTEPVFAGFDGTDYVVELASAEMVRELTPDLTHLACLPVRGVTVTACATPEGFDAGETGAGSYDFVSRFFAPAVGILEDPVTGSAHCSLATYWAQRLQKTEFVAYQASARGGTLKVKLVNDRVQLSGQAVTVLRGELVAV